MKPAIAQTALVGLFLGNGPFASVPSVLRFPEVSPANRFSYGTPYSSINRGNYPVASDFVQLPTRFRAKLDELGSLKAGWDGDDADPISAFAIQSTKELLVHLLQEHESLREPFVVPTFDGSIQLEWHDHDRTLELSFTGAKWISLGVELAEGQTPERHTVSIVGPDDYPVAGKCYEWFVRRDSGRAAWPSR